MYIYLKEKQFVGNWLNKGTVPIKPASTYRDEERSGNRTPDENLLIEIKGEIIKPGIKDVVNNAIDIPYGSINFVGNAFNGNEVVGQNITYTQSYEDGLVLSMSTELSIDIMNRLGDKKAVIEIVDLGRLKASFDAQIGKVGIDRLCQYTEMDERNHFLKHISDAWQKEYRWFWSGFNAEFNVTVPIGIARDVTNQIITS